VGSGEVYATIDENYRKIMRFQAETNINLGFFDDIYVSQIHKLTALLGLEHSHSAKKFILQSEVEESISFFEKLCPGTKSPIDKISEILFKWSGATIISIEDGYQLKVDPDILRGQTYIHHIPHHPGHLSILDETF